MRFYPYTWWARRSLRPVKNKEGALPRFAKGVCKIAITRSAVFSSKVKMLH